MLMMSESAHSNIRILAPEQAHELLGVHVRIPEDVWATGAPNAIVSAVAGILGVKVALVGRDEWTWSVLSEAGAGAAVPPIAQGASQVFDRVAEATTVVVEAWRHGEEVWTLIAFSRRSVAPAVLMLYGDWTVSSAT